ncbi:MAG: sigma-70 family RNA polymerase sigma factor [Gemmatimonadota bacterium]
MSGDASLGAKRREPDDQGSPEHWVADSHPDALLMEGVARGESTALGGLMETHWSSLVQYATALIGCRDTAEDVAQAVFVHVWETREKWAHSGSVTGYLFRIARNLSVGRVRHDEVRTRHGPQVVRLQPRSLSPLEAAQDREFESALEQALRALPERRREAFELVRFRGLSLDEAGAVMSVSRRTVANHLYLAALDLGKKLRRFRD